MSVNYKINSKEGTTYMSMHAYLYYLIYILRLISEFQKIHDFLAELASRLKVQARRCWIQAFIF